MAPKHRLFGLSSVELLFVGAEEFSPVELVHEKPFISLGTRVLERSEPKIAGDGCQLLGQGYDLKVHHELEN